MIVVGLTGGIASGKSTVAQMLKERGAALLEADKIGHSILRRGTVVWQEIIEAFGDGVLTPEGDINRPALGAMVFGNAENLAKLNAISHPRIRAITYKSVQELRSSGQFDVAVVEAALLFEAHWDEVCDESWVTYVPEDVAKDRLITRNGLTEEQALARIRSQMPIEEKRRRGDVVIDNSGDLESLTRQVDEEWKKLLDRVSGKAPRLREAAVGAS